MEPCKIARRRSGVAELDLIGGLERVEVGSLSLPAPSEAKAAWTERGASHERARSLQVSPALVSASARVSGPKLSHCLGQGDCLVCIGFGNQSDQVSV